MWNQPPMNALSVAPGFLRYPFIVMLPRNMISPMVSPSHGTGCIVSGSSTAIASCNGVRTPCRPFRSARWSIGIAAHDSCLLHTEAGPYTSVKP